MENSIEEKILEMQKKKQAIQEGIYDKDKQLIRYQLIGITISVMALASFIFALYYLTR